MAGLLEDINNKRPEEIRELSQNSLEWFRLNLRRIRERPVSLLRAGDTVTTTYTGRMYMFFYDAKHKETLPYWDRFPLVIILQHYNDGFLGLNLHYIPPRFRVVLLNELYTYLVNKKEMDESTRLQISYDIIKSVTRLKYAKPCLKRYLKSHLDSRVSEVPVEYWDMMAMLPSQQFTVNANTVYSKSRKQINV